MVLELERKAKEIRKILIQTVSKTGGHLAPNLGVVELTLALHEVFDFTKDKILFDVGHQSYVHKIITDRKERFSTLRSLGGIGPFQDPKESSWDHFISGHAGTALPAAVGIAKANPDKRVVVVIGDAAIANGHSMEALNYIGGEKVKNIIVILNDNEMSIGKNVGILSKFLGKVMLSSHYFSLRKDIRALVDKIRATGIKETLERIEVSVKNFVFPSNVAENFGYLYLGSIDGHDIKVLLSTLKKAKEMQDGPIFLHVKTVKGKGYTFAEQNTEKFHGIGPFNMSTGQSSGGVQSYSSIFGNKIAEFSSIDRNIFAITAGMLSGTGLKEMQKKTPERVIDTGISEGFATTLAAGLAISGKKPYLCIYSTFLQRSFSQIIHDIVLQNLPVRFIVDRAGIVGEDGKTHHGLHDLSFLLSLPNVKVLNPCCKEELEKMLEFSVNYEECPLAIRIPRDAAYSCPILKDWELGKWQVVQKGEKNLFLAMGSMLKELQEISISGTIVAVSSLNPLDSEYLETELYQYEKIFVCEESYKEASFFSSLLTYLEEKGISKPIVSISLDNFLIPHGNRQELLEKYGLKGTKLLERIEEKMHGGQE